ncbi:MAG: rod shape-determining protein MreC [bacterium]|nr:rod shape-determining protein MreC [bacterium]
MARYISALILLGITAFFLVNNLFSGVKNNLVSLISLRPLTEPELIKQGTRSVLVAKVYSTFPFNNKNLLAVNAGTADGVSVGMPVSLEGNILLGQIIEVSEKQSIIRTIFDKDWSLPVRVGAGQYDALLVGSQNPRLTLIDKTNEINVGDVVISAKKDFPYGLKVGEISKVNELLASSFKEADLVFPYNPKDLREVAIFVK